MYFFLLKANVMILKTILLTSVILLSYHIFYGQSGFPYEKEWKLIDSLMSKKNLPKSALIEVNKVYTAAKKDKLEAQWVKAIIYRDHLQETDDKSNISQTIAALENEIFSAPPRVAALLKSIEAEKLYQYLQENRYEMENRTGIVHDTSADITSWTIDRFNQRIRNLYLSSIEDSRLLLQTPLDHFDAVLSKGNSRVLRPTLYDLLAWRALDYFGIDETEQFTADNQLMENPNLFSEAPLFMHYVFPGNDSASNQITVLKLYQQLLRVHAKDVLRDAWIDADISRIQFVYRNAQMMGKDSLYMKALDRITKQFSSLSVTSRAWDLESQWWASQAALYDPLKDSLHRFDFLNAIAICEQVIKHPDSSEGKFNCERLLLNIRRHSFNLNIEKVNLPNQPFRMLVTYKNINHLYGRIIRIDDATRESFEKNSHNPKFWQGIIRMPFESSFQQAIPETRDYQQHRVEIKMDPLAVGQYALLISSDSSFSDKAIVGLTTFFSSSIAFVQNDQDYFVVDRDSGHPLSGVQVKAVKEKYTNKGEVIYTRDPYSTDIHGHFRIKTDKRYYDVSRLEFSFGKDYLSENYYTTYYRDNEEDENHSTDWKLFEKKALKDNIFTDRSIYRPGQTVYFKGLLITRDFKTRKYKVADQIKTKVFLLDVNEQKIDSLILKSNDFGSIQGSFHLPQNLLNGEFRIQDAETSDELAFSVEEYKRPSFYVDYDSVRGSYQIGDTVKIQGSVLAYAGNSIDGARLTWRVYREARFPYPWLFRFSPSNSEKEIAHGESTADKDGKFGIQFIAMPDRSVSQISKPVYSYRIESDVTDANGESRSAVTTIAASYQSFEIVSPLPFQSRMLKDSLYLIPVTTKNASGLFVKEKLTVTLFALKAPNRLIRKRFWEQPDQYVMSEPDYIRAFPYDEYRNETDVNTWDQTSAVFEKTDSTTVEGFFVIDKKALSIMQPGGYLLQFKARDRDGQEIIDKKYIDLFDDNGKSGAIGYNLIPVEEISAEPGNAPAIHTGSDAKDIFVIRARQGISDTATAFSFYNLNQQTSATRVDIKEADRGGFALNDVFVKNNRWYTSEHTIHIPWTNKELQISYKTWKDKTLPGSREQWKIKISDNRKDQLTAEILTSMYDASLDQFKGQSWQTPDIYPVYARSNSWDKETGFEDVRSRVRPRNEYPSNATFQNTYDALVHFGSGNRIMYQAVTMYEMGNELEKRSSGLGASNEPSKVRMDKFAPPKIVKDEEVVAERKPPEVGKPEDTNPKQKDGNIQIRKNFNETAFFQPDLKTDAEGNVEISFTMPEALTQWKWMVLAHTKDLSFGYSEKKIVAQKELMLQTNMPRFFREGDTMLLPVKIANLSSQTMTGTVQLEWIDANNNQNTDQALGNIKNSQTFSANASQSAVVFFPAVIPSHFTQPLLYRIVAKTNGKGSDYSDGEEAIIPVLSNRMLVTESLPLNMDGKAERHFEFEKLLKSNTSSSLQNQSLTVEYTTNPAWYAVQSLPYLMEFPYECAEQTFNRFYANALAAHIVQVSPAMQAVFEKWKNADTAALLSNLQKNEELKSALLRETPWVLEAQNETQQKKNLALLFDLLKMRVALKSALDKLQQMQSDDGGFAWFKGGRDDRYITQYIVSGIGRLKKLKAIPADLQVSLDKMAKSGIGFLDNAIKTDYEKRDKSTQKSNLDPVQIQYLYMRSFFPDVDVPGNIFNALNYYRKQAVAGWTKESVYMQGMIALFLFRIGDIKTAKDILASLKENATTSTELGTYWKSVNNGFYWQEAPVETQALLIETFQDLHADQKDTDQMKYWLLQQKRTRHWPTTKATADACYALLLGGSDWLSSRQTVAIQLGTYKIGAEKSEAGTGYFKEQIPGNQVKPDMGNIQVSIQQNSGATANLQPPIANRQPPIVPPSWGAIYWQYFENLDKITSAQTQLSISKGLFIEKNSDKGPVLEIVSSANPLKPGDKLMMRIIIKTDRDLEYVHLKDMRAACLEPVNILSGYQWQGGLGYYQTTRDASTSFFFDLLPKGTHVFEYPVFVTTSGNYSNGISSLECMYAPEFAAHSEGIHIRVESK